MANAFKTSDLVAATTAAFDGNSTLLRTASHDYEGQFTQRYYAPGQSVDYLLDNRYVPQDGDTIVPQAVIDRYRTITLKPFLNYPINLRRGDDERNFREISKRFVEPAGADAADILNGRLNEDVLGKVYFHVGTKGTLIQNFAGLQDAYTLMQSYGMTKSRPWYSNLSPINAASLKNSLNNQFNTSINDPILKKNVLGMLSGFRVMEDSTVVTHESALTSGASVTVKTTIADTAETLTLTGLTDATGTMTKGTLLEFEGYRFIRPRGHQKLPTLYKFSRTVKEDATVASNEVTVTVDPINFAADGIQNVDAQIVATTPVTVIDNYTANICFVEKALQVVMPPPGKFADDVDSKTFSVPKTTRTILTLTLASDVNNNNITYRLDNLHGYDWQPEMACLIIT